MATPQEQAAFEAARRQREQQQQQASGIGAVGSAANTWQMGKDLWDMADDAPAIAEGAGLMTPATEGVASGVSAGASTGGGVAGFTAEGNAAYNAAGMGVPESQAVFNAGASEAGGGLAEGASTQSGMSGLGTVAAAAAAVYGAYQLAEGWGHMSHKEGIMAGATMGAGIGSFIPVVGTVIGAVIGATIGFAASFVTSGKHEDQNKRDAVRDALVQNGMISPDYKLQLADINQDGTPDTFDIGIDGGARDSYAFSGGRRPHEVNEEHPYSVQSVAWANPLAVVLTGGDAKLTSNFAGYFANASMSNTNDIEGVRANMLQIMKDLKMNKSSAEATLKSMLDSGKIDDLHYAAYMASLDTLFSGDSKKYVTTPWNDFADEVEAGRQQVETKAQKDPTKVVAGNPSAKIADPSGSGTFHATADATAAELDPQGQAAAAESASMQTARLQQEAANKAARLANEKANKVSVAQSMISQSDPMSHIAQVASRAPQGAVTNQAGTSAAQAAIEAAKLRQQDTFGRVYA